MIFMHAACEPSELWTRLGEHFTEIVTHYIHTTRGYHMHSMNTINGLKGQILSVFTVT